ncbi:hypothetical protein [Streptomyces sp. MUM 2J]|uniref:hypothetical protein n=1 Tax=Streptomyces sp. MUM 2J TaxID=2791987 RepID=UPI001F041B40|nr:hypothetical protein [Streptomyces sp. MUM 2J]MCH0566854.1 hypothetical protein [Streptomyces sp. MUM 2J]
MLELRLDSPRAEPCARFGASNGPVCEVVTRIPVITGVHQVFVTVLCLTEKPCVEFHWFATT